MDKSKYEITLRSPPGFDVGTTEKIVVLSQSIKSRSPSQ